MGTAIDLDAESQVGAPSPAPSSNGADAGKPQNVSTGAAATEFEASFKIPTDCRYFLSNRTPYLIHITHPESRFGELLLPPLAERVITGARLQPFESLLLCHRQRHEVVVRRYVETISLVDTLIWVAWLSLVLIGGVAVYDLLSFGTLLRPEIGTAVAIGLIVLAVVLVRGTRRELERKKKASADGTEVGDIAFGIGGSYSDGNETARSARQLLTLTIVLTVGAVLPAIGILVGTDANDYLVMNGGLRVKSGLESRMVARVIQITYTCVLSLFPALLFFQFDRLQAGSIRSTWIRALFRMDGRMQTVADIDATYGHAMYEASNNSEDSVRGLGGKNSPIVIATILIALGWTVLVIRTESFDFSGTTSAAQSELIANQQAAIAEDAAAAAAGASTDEEAMSAAAVAEEAATAASEAQAAIGEIAERSIQVESAPTPDAPIEQPTLDTLDDARAAADAASTAATQAALTARADSDALQSTPYFQILAPSPSAAGMAFLGAYFFGIYLVLRSYFRGDLRARIYNQITARLVTVVVVAYLINAILFPNTSREEIIWTLAFLAGVVPTTVLDRVMHAMGGLVKSVAGDAFAANRPLEHIDGVDIYDASRLEAEGIPDVAALASSDLASVMLQTRLPIGRLVDWADQAALMVVVGMPGSQLDPRVQALRKRGIRTGTDLLALAEHGGNIDGIATCLNIPANDRRVGLIQARMGDGDGDSALTEIDDNPASPGSSPDPDSTDLVSEVDEEQRIDIRELCRAIRRQPVMAQILQWRSSSLDDPDRSWVLLPDGRSGPAVSPSYIGPLPDPTDSCRAM
jgi:hypothetical protein